MGRDWEAHLYSEARVLTAARVERLLSRLQASGLHLNLDGPDQIPIRASFVTVHGRARLRDIDVEDLFRGRPPPRGYGYGVLPLRAHRAGLPEDQDAFLHFGAADADTGLESVGLAVDGALFASNESRALDVAFEWLALLAEECQALYGWADWETATFLQAAPSRREARAGRLPRLMRFNAFGPSFLLEVDRRSLAVSAERWLDLPNGGVVFQPGHAVEFAAFS